MKKLMMVLALAFAAFAAGATNWYVSSDGRWDPEGKGTTKTTVKAAVTAASAGDTIWVQDGTVIDSERSVSKIGGVYSTIHLSKAVTLRSESGYVDEANGRGAIIRGKFHSVDAPLGSNAQRCVCMTSGASLVGFVLEQAGTYSTITSPGGGGVYGVGTVLNCVFRGIHGTTGGAVCSTATSLSDCLVLENCAITNNTAKFYGAGAAGLVILRNCDISRNTSDLSSESSSGGGAVHGESNTKRAKMFGCLVKNNLIGVSKDQNYGGGARWVDAVNTSFVSNSVGGCGGAAVESSLSNCLVLGNLARGGNSSTIGGNGGGLYECTATNCVIAFNRLEGGGSNVGFGGGAYNSDLYNCEVASNTVKDCSYPEYRGGAGFYSTGGHECYNTLFIGHTINRGVAAVSSSDATKKVLLVNCTITGNTSGNGVGGCYNAVMVNTICQGNAGRDQIGGSIVATNSCATGLSDFEGPGNITNDPMFIGTGDHPYALSSMSPCRDNGAYDADNPAWGWVTDPADPRSQDLTGKPRLQGAAPDMGCYEFAPPEGSRENPWNVGEEGHEGEVVAWTNGVGGLVIEGAGKMKDWEDYSDQPWADFRNSINTAEIKLGVTSIGRSAFESCYNMTSVTVLATMPPELEGEWLFDGTPVEAIYVPKASVAAYKAAEYWSAYGEKIVGMDSVGEAAYVRASTDGNCAIVGTGVATNLPAGFNLDSITSAVVEDGITEIGARFFKKCRKMNTVTLGKDVVFVGANAFYFCVALEKITVENAAALESLKGAFVYQTAIKSDGSLYPIPNVTAPGCDQYLEGKVNLTDPKWADLGELDPDKPMEAHGDYKFFRIVLKKIIE